MQFVEANTRVVASLCANLDTLLSDKARANVSQQDALGFLKSNQGKRYDVVFLDPPFQSDLAGQAIRLLLDNNWLNEKALVYIEQDSNHDVIDVPEQWQVHRQGSAGQSRYTVYICE